METTITADAARPSHRGAIREYFKSVMPERPAWSMVDLLVRWKTDWGAFDDTGEGHVINAAAEAWASQRDGTPEPASAALGTRTAIDLSYGPPPSPELPPFLSLDPGESMVLYGPGGVGKGTIAAWLLLRWVQTHEEDAAILDYENHPSEWGRRLRGLGATPDELERIHYRNPFAPDWEHTAVNLNGASHGLHQDFLLHNVGLAVVDSIVMASDGDLAMGGVESTKLYFAGLATVGIRSITIAHVAGNATKWPDKPFGSVYIHNLARETWAIEQTSNSAEDEAFDALLTPLKHTARIELRNQKLSSGARKPPAIYDLEFFANGDVVFRAVEARTSTKDLVRSVLAATPGLTLGQIVKAIQEDAGLKVSEKAVSNALQKHRDLFAADQSRRPYKWSNQ